MKRGYLSSRFQYVRRHFFPRWDAKKKWSVRYIPNAPFHGRCDDRNRVILINHIGDEDELDLLLIHEICHVYCKSHKERWQDRMSEAARRAEVLDRRLLSIKIMSELEAVNAVPEIRAEHVYRAIESRIIDSPSVRYKDMVLYIAHDFGFTPRAFLCKYKRARKVFDETKRELL